MINRNGLKQISSRKGNITNINKTGTDQHKWWLLLESFSFSSPRDTLNLAPESEVCPYAQGLFTSPSHVKALRYHVCSPSPLSPEWLLPLWPDLCLSLSSLSGQCHCVPLLISRILLFLSKEVWQRWWSTFFNVPTVTLFCVCLI